MPTGFYRRPKEREITEATKIKELLAKEGPGFIMMNAKLEFNRCVLPGVTRVATDRDKKRKEKWR